MGYYQEALENWRLYQTASDERFFTIIEQDTQFIEERHALEMETLKKQKAKNQIILIGIIIATALVAILMVQRKHLRIKSMEKALLEKEREQYNLLYQQAEEEKDKLTDLLRENKELDEYKRGIINQRLELLNKFFASYITNNNEVSNKADKEIKEFIKNKDNFMESTRIAYTTSNPQFIKYLEEKGLTNWEICYCCLYALGLRGKEVGSYIKMRSHYNISTEIRAKLGINEHETNLGIYIRKLLKNFNS
jgi:uncharacterized DUF497 family protein